MQCASCSSFKVLSSSLDHLHEDSITKAYNYSRVLQLVHSDGILPLCFPTLCASLITQKTSVQKVGLMQSGYRDPSSGNPEFVASLDHKILTIEKLKCYIPPSPPQAKHGKKKNTGAVKSPAVVCERGQAPCISMLVKMSESGILLAHTIVEGPVES